MSAYHFLLYFDVLSGGPVERAVEIEVDESPRRRLPWACGLACEKPEVEEVRSGNVG